MRIDGLPNLQKVSQPNQRNESTKPGAKAGRADDSVEISRSAQEAAELTESLKAAPETGNPRLGQIRARVQSGYYNTEEVRQEIAGALLDADSIRPVAEEVAEVRTVRRQLDSVPDVRSERVAETRERATSGYYDQTQIRRETADSIIDASA